MAEHGAAALVELDRVELAVESPVPTHILGPVDLRVAAGESVAVVGPSGAGKSSLMHVVGAMVPPTRGSYRFAGMDVGSRPRRALAALRARSIGFVFQAAHLIEERTVLENVLLGLPTGPRRADGPRRRALSVLADVGIAGLAHRRAKLLSGGERQRVAVARALVKDPALVIADEPTGSLDRRTGHAVLDLLAGLPDRGVTLLLVTHDPAAAARAGRTLTMVDGRLVDGW